MGPILVLFKHFLLSVLAGVTSSPLSASSHLQKQFISVWNLAFQAQQTKPAMAMPSSLPELLDLEELDLSNCKLKGTFIFCMPAMECLHVELVDLVRAHPCCVGEVAEVEDSSAPVQPADW